MRIAQAAVYSAVVTWFCGSFSFLFGLLRTLAEGGNFIQFLIGFVFAMAFLFVLCTALFYEVGKAFAEMNRAGRSDAHEKTERGN